jgi:predicted acetyltransferase
MPKSEVVVGRLTDSAALQLLYSRAMNGTYGTTERNDAYWNWLLARGAHDRIYLYRENGQPLGYVVVRGATALEIIDTTEDCRAAARLLEKFALDAIEQGRHAVHLYAPMSHQVHAWVSMADGQAFCEADGLTWYAKLLSARGTLRRLGTELHARHVMNSTIDWGLRIGDDAFKLKAGKSSLQVIRGTASRGIAVDQGAATQLLLGSRDALELAALGGLLATDRSALATAQALFPTLNVWRHPWDFVPTINP